MSEICEVSAPGLSIPVYAADPPAGSGPAVVLLHAWWGLTPFFRGFAVRLAGAGFSVYAPDYYRGRTAATVEGAAALRETVNRRAAGRDLKALVEYLGGRAAGRPEAGGVGVVGFSLGCSLALDAAGAAPRVVRAVVLFYGTGGGRFGAFRGPVQGHFAASDPWEPEDDVAALGRCLAEAGCEVDFRIYPGTGHWFMEEDRPGAYDPVAAGEAWTRTVAFLSARLADCC